MHILMNRMVVLLLWGGVFRCLTAGLSAGCHLALLGYLLVLFSSNGKDRSQHLGFTMTLTGQFFEQKRIRRTVYGGKKLIFPILKFVIQSLLSVILLQ